MTVSSSAIRRLLLQGNVSEAANCLGYQFFLDGTVVNGYRVGRKIGFPTANLRIGDCEKLVPADGVYAVYERIAVISASSLWSCAISSSMESNFSSGRVRQTKDSRMG